MIHLLPDTDYSDLPCKIRINFDQKTVDRVTALAKRHGVTVSGLMREMVKRQLEAIS
jgi:hypothetical protein